MNLYENFPVLVIDNQLKADNIEGMALRKVITVLINRGLAVIELETDVFDQRLALSAGSEISCILLGWNKAGAYRSMSQLGKLVALFRERNEAIPIFLMTDKLEIKNIPVDTIKRINGYIWKTEDTPGFIAGRIENAVKKYLDGLLPPFFRALIKYTGESKYAWHTPGHMGGVAFLKSPAGRIFHSFFGENAFRADISVSVPELGSLLDHTRAIHEAEVNAARIFGADITYFVTNGTSTSNRIVLQAVVKPGDLVLVDRNCHKSIMQAVIITGAIPIYLRSYRNNYGIIGPVHADELSVNAINKKIKDCPLLSDQTGKVKITVITNSTYDGICYHVGMIKERLQQNGTGVTEHILFDEAWYAYARFNPIYTDRCATFCRPKDPAYNLIFATQSTHKLLAAFSQASMIHIMDQTGGFSHDRFNEAYMMHASTSPQYGIIASLDMAAKMMEGGFGRSMTRSAIEEANIFRKKMVQIDKELNLYGNWWFKVWQPPAIEGQDWDQVDDYTLNTDPACWILRPDDNWHGFEKIADNYAMLDPIKVTVLTPGMEEPDRITGPVLPAPIVTKFLNSRGIVAEKTGFYSFLILFSIGITSGKSGTLLAELFAFKKVYDTNPPLGEVFPELAGYYPAGMTIRALCQEMHSFLKAINYHQLFKSVYAYLPEQCLTPAGAYRELTAANVKPVKIAELAGKIAAVMVTPYPPGIPVIMPGERFNSLLVKYLQFYQNFNKRFPGFENELQGVAQGVAISGGEYTVYCVQGGQA
ncbi:Orn/Lys/Arg family decarboxylase [Desulfotruncus alcoholivorax]|uniref:Orn/Lys/Arg family decarboxylase n=1 Tax=Desulfotruncus alcoholivorax TaxID=265477 RepID=UPI0004806AD7|nr:Orn/Lys/Arg decarboxylase N-terminal domain-containing protein [Desulfotruncus alcoholivorax]